MTERSLNRPAPGKDIMTQRSILAGQTPKIVIHAGGSVSVQGLETDRVQAETDSRAGLKIERRTAAEFGRARAKVGERVLFDIRLTVPAVLKKDADDEVIDVQLGGDGKVSVPRGSDVKVYAGRDIEVTGVRGQVTVYAGSDIKVRDVRTVVQASAGGALDFECDTVEGDDLKFTAGDDLRCFVRSLIDVTYLIDDLGGYWEATIGEGRVKIRLKCGGDVTLVTDQPITGEMLGTIERPSNPDRPA
jgi:hypothetical protein